MQVCACVHLSVRVSGWWTYLGFYLAAVATARKDVVEGAVTVRCQSAVDGGVSVHVLRLEPTRSPVHHVVFPDPAAHAWTSLRAHHSAQLR